MRPTKIAFWILSVFSTILIGIGAFMYFFPMHPDQVGRFTTEEFPHQTKILNDYLEKSAKAGTCVSRSYGRDEAHVFFEYTCNDLRSFGRAAYDSQYEFSSLETATEGSFYEQSIIRMYPKIVYEKYLENNLAP